MVVARTPARFVLASTVAIALGFACGIDAVGTGAVLDDGGTSSSGGSSGATTSSGGSSGAVDAPACTPTGPEVCEDGVDNDCNGQKDCEDTACGQYTCSKVEAGWTTVSVRAAGASDGGVDAGVCAEGWTNPRTLLDNVRASGTTCACACGDPIGNPCANGARTASFRNGSSACNDGDFTLNTDGACHALAFPWDPGNGDGNYNAVAMAAPGIAQVACAATAALPPIVDDGAVLVCDLVPGAPIGCSGGSCVKRPGTDEICLLHDGDTATCPAGLPVRKVLAPSFTDARSCGGCTCGTNATQCSNTRIAFYSNAGCTQDQRTANTGASCNSISGSVVPTHYRYEATPDGACIAAAATVAASGAVTLTTPSTLCCPQ